MFRLVIASVLFVAVASPVYAQDHGSGSSGCGDLFGELVRILRHETTGQPILEKRMIEYPQDTLDWGYCPVPLDAYGNELELAPNSCDPVDPGAVVEIDSFGRLSAGRTKERNIRMHFDEVITSIKLAERVGRDPAGRIALGSGCTRDPATATVSCASWAPVDSPQENLALYHRVMKYGHLQTDPLEVDGSHGGDPALGVQYRPALDAADHEKFDAAAEELLPRASGARRCFPEGAFDPSCAAPEPVGSEDFVLAAGFLGAAADKHGSVTVDLVQYLNRILKITRATPASAAALNTLPALIRECRTCPPVPAVPGLPAPADERFVDYGALYYARGEWFAATVSVIKPRKAMTWVLDPAVPLLPYLEFRNPGGATGENVAGFVRAASDGVRSVEFLHNYEVPEDLGWSFR